MKIYGAGDRGGPAKFVKEIRRLNIKSRKILVINATKSINCLIGSEKKIFRLGPKFQIKPDSTLRERIGIHVANLKIAVLATIFADEIIYQSESNKKVWEKNAFLRRKKYSVIGNILDIKAETNEYLIDTKFVERIVVLESSLGKTELSRIGEIVKKNKLNAAIIYGAVAPDLKELFQEFDYKGYTKIEYHSLTKKDVILGMDFNPGCPNIMLESLSKGLNFVAINNLVYKEFGLRFNFPILEDDNEIRNFERIVDLDKLTGYINNNKKRYIEILSD